MIVALIASVVGAIIGALLTRFWTPDLSPKIESLRLEFESFKKERAAQQLEGDLWASKFVSAASQVVKIGPSGELVRSPDGSMTALYGLVFREADLRHRIELYLVQPDSRRSTFFMQALDSQRLRLPVVRQTIDETLHCLGRFRAEYPDWAKYLPQAPS
jgi:hypothetical protein